MVKSCPRIYLMIPNAFTQKFILHFLKVSSYCFWYLRIFSEIPSLRRALFRLRPLFITLTHQFILHFLKIILMVRQYILSEQLDICTDIQALSLIQTQSLLQKRCTTSFKVQVFFEGQKHILGSLPDFLLRKNARYYRFDNIIMMLVITNDIGSLYSIWVLPLFKRTNYQGVIQIRYITNCLNLYYLGKWQISSIFCGPLRKYEPYRSNSKYVYFSNCR